MAQDKIQSSRGKALRYCKLRLKSHYRRLLTDEPSADCDSLVSTLEPPVTNRLSFRFESPPGQDVSTISNESIGSSVLLDSVPSV